jgi:hypothetical protein
VKAKRPCLDCGTPTSSSRCPTHTPTRLEEPLQQRILKQWRTEHGNLCAGIPELDHAPHYTLHLSVDHLLPQSLGGTLADGYRVVCTQINATRGAG